MNVHTIKLWTLLCAKDLQNIRKLFLSLECFFPHTAILKTYTAENLYPPSIQTEKNINMFSFTNNICGFERTVCNQQSM